VGRKGWLEIVLRGLDVDILGMNRKLYRSKMHRVIAGVCGGLGEYFDIDPVIIRALFVLAALGGGFGVIAYLVLWVVIPEETGEEEVKVVKEVKGAKAGEMEKGERGQQPVLGVVLVILGLIFLFNNLMPHWHIGRWWPFLLVVVGAALLARRG